jgi:DnaJ-class molecular chaperone
MQVRHVYLTSGINESIITTKYTERLVLLMPNYYDVLGISRTANDKDIRQAYRKLARQYHPDVNPGDKTAEEKFKQINEAHSVLSDPDKRRKYDKHGDRWQYADQIEEAEAQARAQAQARAGRTSFEWFAPGSGGSAGEHDVTFDGKSSNIFETLFRNLGQEVRQPSSSEYPVEITLEEAFQGTTRLIELSGGRRLEVKIPPGVDNGSRVHIPAGRGRESNLYLIISVQPHSAFERKGRNLYREVEVPLEDAVLGGEIMVPTLRSRVALTIPPETQNGQRFRLAGQGMPSLNQPASRGDLYATVKVKLPSGLTPEERELFQQLKELRAARRR